MAEMSYVFLDHLFRLQGSDLQRYPLKPMMERRYGPGGNKLEQDGISCVNPAENQAENAQNHHIYPKHLLPDGAPRFVGYIQGDKIHAACRRMAP